MDGWTGFFYGMQAIRKDDTATIEEFDQSEHRICLGENDRYRIYFSCTDMHDIWTAKHSSRLVQI